MRSKYIKSLITTGILLASSTLFAATTRYSEIRNTLQPNTTSYGVYLGSGTIRNLNVSTLSVTAAGTATVPALKIGPGFNSGFSQVGTNGLDFVANGTFAGEISNGGQWFFPDGTVGNPELTFGNDTNTGFYRAGASNIAMSLGGAKCFDFKTTGLTTNNIISTTATLGTIAVTSSATFQGNYSFSGTTVTNTGTVINGTLTNNSTMTFTGTTSLLGPITANGSTPTSGMSLTARGAGLAPTWAFTGKIIQIASMTVTASSATTSAVLCNTNVTKAITVTSASNLVAIVVFGSIFNNTASDAAILSVMRGSFPTGTDLSPGGAGFCESTPAGTGGSIMPCTIFWIDAPGASGSTTYTATFKRAGGGTASLGGGYITSSGMILIEIGQ